MWGVWPPGPRTTPLSVAFCGFCLVRLFVAATREGQSKRRRPGGLREGPGAPGTLGAGRAVPADGQGKYVYICNVCFKMRKEKKKDYVY